MPNSSLTMYTIFRDPLDYPGRFVVRRFLVRAGIVVGDELPLCVVDSLEAARSAIPAEQDTRLARDPADLPSVVESWV